jgi:ribosome-associated toxin RatA of RatAB toxin-antitoxin module
MKRVSRSAIVDHPASHMYALVDDIESYPRFLPWCVAAKVEERTEATTRATLTIGMRGLRTSFTTHNEHRTAEAIDMRLVQGPFRRFAAAWRFRPLSDKACSIEFSMEYEMSGPLARMLSPLLERIADTMVDAFTRRAAELHGAAR